MANNYNVTSQYRYLLSRRPISETVKGPAKDVTITPDPSTRPVSSLLPVHNANLSSINVVNASENIASTPVITVLASAAASGEVHSSEALMPRSVHSTYQPTVDPGEVNKITKLDSPPISHNSSKVNHGRCTAHTLLVSQFKSLEHNSASSFKGIGSISKSSKFKSSVISSAPLGPISPSRYRNITHLRFLRPVLLYFPVTVRHLIRLTSFRKFLPDFLTILLIRT